MLLLLPIIRKVHKTMKTLEELLQALFFEERLLNDFKALHEKREAIDNQYEKLKKSIELIKRRGGDSSQLDQEFLTLMNQKKEVDRELDLAEDVTEDSVQFLRESIISFKHETNPDLKQTYTALLTQIGQYKRIASHLESLHEINNEIAHTLGETLIAWGKVKKFGVFGYMFGANPNRVIIKALAHTHKKCDEALSLLNSLHELPEATPELLTWYTSYRNLITHLRQECQTDWNFRKIRKDLVKIKEELSLHIKREEELVEKYTLERHRMENHLKSLLS